MDRAGKTHFGAGVDFQIPLVKYAEPDEGQPDTLDLLDWEDVTLHSFARGDRAR